MTLRLPVSIASATSTSTICQLTSVDLHLTDKYFLLDAPTQSAESSQEVAASEHPTTNGATGSGEEGEDQGGDGTNTPTIHTFIHEWQCS